MYDDLIGQEFDWFAIDNAGQIAVFSTAGWGPIPNSIATDYKAHQLIFKEFELPNYGNENVWNDFAKYGFYVYDWQLYEGPYRRESTPLTTIGEDLKCRIKRLSNVPKLDLYFEHAFSVNIQP